MIEKLKEENTNLKKLADDNLNSSTDAKVKRLKNICIKLEKEKKKLEEDQVKEKTEILKEKLKVEDELQRAVFQNKKLQVKDETYTGIFDCLKEYCVA